MPPADWDVEEALDQVVEAIHRGALVYDMSIATGEGLREGYREDFKTQRQAGVEWKEARVKVLPLAVSVGSLAAYLTTMKSVSETGTLAEVLDEQLTYTAAWTVAHWSSDCRKLGFFGGFCRTFPTPKKFAEEDVQTLLRVSGLVGPLVGLALRG